MQTEGRMTRSRAKATATPLTAPLSYASTKKTAKTKEKAADLPRTILFDVTNEPDNSVDENEIEGVIEARNLQEDFSNTDKNEGSKASDVANETIAEVAATVAEIVDSTDLSSDATVDSEDLCYASTPKQLTPSKSPKAVTNPKSVTLKMTPIVQGTDKVGTDSKPRRSTQSHIKTPYPTIVKESEDSEKESENLPSILSKLSFGSPAFGQYSVTPKLTTTKNLPNEQNETTGYTPINSSSVKEEVNQEDCVLPTDKTPSSATSSFALNPTCPNSVPTPSFQPTTAKSQARPSTTTKKEFSASKIADEESPTRGQASALISRFESLIANTSQNSNGLEYAFKNVDKNAKVAYRSVTPSKSSVKEIAKNTVVDSDMSSAIETVNASTTDAQKEGQSKTQISNATPVKASQTPVKNASDSKNLAFKMQETVEDKSKMSHKVEDTRSLRQLKKDLKSKLEKATQARTPSVDKEIDEIDGKGHVKSITQAMQKMKLAQTPGPLKGVPVRKGKHIRFNDENEEPEAVTPKVLLRGLPPANGSHIRFD